MTTVDKKAAFLREVLGADGAEALLKAVRRNGALDAVLMPRAILSWTMTAASWGYEGHIPGLEGSVATFRKSETPGLFSGQLGAIQFTETTLYRLAAHVAVALQAEPGPIDKQLRDLDIARLGKSIDVLAKAQLLASNVKPRVMSDHGDFEVLHAGLGTKPYLLRRKSDQRVLIDQVPTLADAQKLAEEQVAKTPPPQVPPTPELDKVELPGMTAKPREALAPIAPEQPRTQPKQKAPELPSADGKGPGVKAPPRTPEKIPSTEVKPPTMKIGKTEAHSQRCQLCREVQFSAPGRFSGCLCLRALAHDVLVKSDGPRYELTFGASWDEDARSALFEVLRLG